ncbi:HigA family addiction module antidote protein [Azoarcus sp. L1K30]|uniref:HigA family addiction module antitoxin n=1 Tax=Azoarcus sp. L1K30 TaxID=2820277 RepID=UPI001B8324BF|nr:HigA family addiction module antitoxin [Azoarcus sp. L1K30]MBR0566149.1 HigA family addiction module antidote protein [Azoarcus sp. L1K30]
MMTTTRAGSGPRLFSVAARVPGRAPQHPGRFLETRFMRPAGISQDALARALGISRRRVNELTRGRRAFTPDTAVRLAIFFGTDALLWMHLQAAWDTHLAWRSLRVALGTRTER